MNKKVKKSFVPKVGDEVEVFFQALHDSPLTAENIPLDIVYEDDYIIAINKPAGMVAHPACGNWSGTFVNALLYHCKDLINIDDDIRPGIVHRLDKNTSGIMIAAKTTKAQSNLIGQFKDRKVIKKYLAICVNKPENQIVDVPIIRNPFRRKEMTVLPQGKPSITKIETLGHNDKLSLVLATPKSGRTHQIRVHLKHIKTPILGDEVYGSISVNNNFNAIRQLLHAASIEFTHPITNKKMLLEAPTPKDFQKFVNLLK